MPKNIKKSKQKTHKSTQKLPKGAQKGPKSTTKKPKGVNKKKCHKVPKGGDLIVLVDKYANK